MQFNWSISLNLARCNSRVPMSATFQMTESTRGNSSLEKPFNFINFRSQSLENSLNYLNLDDRWYQSKGVNNNYSGVVIVRRDRRKKRGHE